MWLSKDPRTGKSVLYSREISEALEGAFQREEPSYLFNLGNNYFKVVFSQMIQLNDRGGARKVQRFTQCRYHNLTNLPLISNNSLVNILMNCKLIDDKLHLLEGSPLSEICMNDVNIEPFLEVYKALLYVMQDLFIVNKYGGSTEDVQLCLSDVMEPVPNYYANIIQGSIYRRIVLSILGLRNLMFIGGSVFLTLQKTKFSSKIDAYKVNEGLPLMRLMTGNTVDLDTVIMNVPLFLKTLNTSLSKDGQPIFPTIESFVKSKLCRETVFTTARYLIDNFINDLNLTESEIKSRRLVLDETSPIHVAKKNIDRGAYPVWHYVNAHISTFHVNVASIPDVIGALLKSPFHLPKAIALSIQIKGNTESMWLDILENALSDSCFNGKWKTLEQFLHSIEDHNSISKVLFRLQKDERDFFNTDFLLNDPTRKEESIIMKKLVLERKLCGFDKKTKTTRFISDEDVDEWIKLTN